MQATKRKINRLAPWLGADLSIADQAAALLGKLRWCGVPFAGGMSILPLIDTPAGVANDLHRHVINLARCVSSADARSEMLELLSTRLFHPDEMATAQRRCLERQSEMGGGLFGTVRPHETPDAEWAADYFCAAWMGRGGHAGKKSEFTQGLALRYTSSGGDSAKRFQSAIESLDGWALALRKWSFTTEDALDMIGRINDDAAHGIYCDPPWPTLGDEYAHAVQSSFHERLRNRLEGFRRTRIVVRYGEHPLIRELYQSPRWTFIGNESRNQQNNMVGEVLIVNGQAPGMESQ